MPIRQVPTIAPVPHGLDSPALEFIVWASTTLGRFEALNGVNETALNEALAMWEGKDTERRADRQAPMRSAAAKKCLQAGLTLEQTSRWLNTTLTDVLDLLYARDRHELILKLEPYVRAQLPTKEIAEATGLKRNYISGVAKAWGVTLPNGNRLQRPEQYTRAYDLVKGGMSRRQAAIETGISQHCVTKLCRDLPGGKRGPKPKCL